MASLLAKWDMDVDSGQGFLLSCKGTLEVKRVLHMKIVLSTVFIISLFGLFGQGQLVFIHGDEYEQVPLFHPSMQQSVINNRLIDLWSQGYLYSGVDSIQADTVYMHYGKHVAGRVDTLRVYNVEEGTFSVETISRGDDFQQVVRKSLWRYANEGHPFVQVKLRGLEIRDETFSGSLDIFPGPVVRFDSISLLSKVNVGRDFLARALEVEKGKPYSERNYQNLQFYLQRLPFLRLQSPPDITFSEGKSIIYLDLAESGDNSFEGVVGLLPRQSSDEKLAITGYLNLGLVNLFKSGKSLDFTWNRFADESQAVDLSYYHPYLLSTPLFLSVQFNLLKQDSSFLTQSWQLESGTFLGKHSEVTVGYEVENGNLIDPQDLDIVSGVADFSSKVYTLGLGSSFYPRPLSLKNQIRYHLKAGLGEKKIINNPAITSDAYDTLLLTSRLIRLNGGFKYLYRLMDRLALYHLTEGQLLYNDQILTNELARLGGLKTIRGFNENFFYAQHYAYSRLEIRQYFERSSYFMAFYDQMILSRQNNYSAPTGFGLGLTLDTSNGLFTFATAMGFSSNIPLDPNNIKIHLGYTSRF